MKKTYSQTAFSIAGDYRRMIKELERRGIGSKTDYDVVITQKLIDTFKKRLSQIAIKKPVL